MCTPDIWYSSLQMRTERARTVNGTFTNATIVTAMAAREGENSIQVTLSLAKTSSLIINSLYI